jgi:hypothetical protein
MRKSKLIPWLFAAAAAVPLIGGAEHAHALLLSSNNSAATFNETTGFITSWQVDGIEQLGGPGSGFYFLVGGSGGEQTVASLTPTLVTQGSPTNPALVTAFYESPDLFRIELRYQLLGGSAGSGFSLLNTQFDMINLSTSQDLTVSVIEFTNMDLDGGAGPAEKFDDVLAIIGDFQNTAAQSDNVRQYQSPITGGNSAPLTGPTARQVGDASALLASLIDGSPTVLDNTLTGDFADPAYGFQFDFVLQRDLPPGPNSNLESFSVLSPKFIQTPPPQPTNTAVTPEPVTAAAMAVGLLAIAGSVMRRRTRM